MDAHGAVCTSRKRSEWLKPVINDDLCMSCTICQEACPVGCIGRRLTGKKDDLHARPYLKDAKACIGCGFCAIECPVDAIVMTVPLRQVAVPAD
jgi:Pyruvate/2-oxoacid:ferredoxin oxidoreductase delta subunit